MSEPGTGEQQEYAPQEEQIDLSGLNVLVAEDNNIQRIILGRVFNALGIDPSRIHLAEDPAKAREIFKKLTAENNPPNLLWSDVHMPGESGPDLLRGLRKDDPHLEAIMSTSMSREELVEENPDLKFDYLGKNEAADLKLVKKTLGQAAKNIKERQTASQSKVG